MTEFNAESFGKSIAGGGGLINAAGAAFGLPTCILDLSKEALAFLPSPVLNAFNSVSNQLRGHIDSAIKSVFHEIAELFGVEEYVGPDGRVRLKAKWSLADIDVGIGGLLGGIDALLAAAGDIYQQYLNVQAFIEEIRECLGQLADALGKSDNTNLMSYVSPEIRTNRLAALQTKLEELYALRDRVVAAQNNFNEEQNIRDTDPDREPRINPIYADDFANTGFRIGELVEQEDLFRLVYGPPRTTDGQFILSIDGLYYDSQSEEGYLPILIQLRDKGRLLDAAEKWKFDFDPNLGGKGTQISRSSFNKWIDSIFDLNVIDDSEIMESHYKADGFLRLLVGQRDKRLMDIQKQIDTLTYEGASTAVLNNLKQSLVSETSILETKVQRRKKQIEIAIKAPAICGEPNPYPTGAIPVNDFSYLQKFNISIALADQQKLVIDTESVDGIILPIIPKFVKSQPKRVGEVINELVIPGMGFDAIITDDLNSSTASAAELNINDMVNTDGLFTLYNFLNSDTTMPSALNTNLNNCYSMDSTNDGYLIARSSKDLFERFGLCAPYFNGITRREDNGVIGLGSFVKLPNTNDFQDWTYGSDGFGFETWIHMPSIENTNLGWYDNGVSSLYRLILSNENTGIRDGAERLEDYNLVPFSNGTDYTRGMIFGFTIDQRWTRKELPSNDFSIQDPSLGYGLVLAPTISYDSSTVAFITTSECAVDSGWLGMYIPHTKATASGKTLADCRLEYLQLGFSLDYKQDTVTVFLDGEELETSSISTVFGTRPHHAVDIPSFKLENSFNYSATSVPALARNSIKSGPRLYPFFTPWIVGGGYTDGNKYGGFMGGDYGGLISGLRGFLGSIKFYKKPITVSGVKKNFDVQKRLFKAVSARPKSIIIALGQSNMDGAFTTMAATIGSNVSISPDVDNEFVGVQPGRYVWSPSSLSNSAGDWLEIDSLNHYYGSSTFFNVGTQNQTFSSILPTNNNYGGLTTSRYFIAVPAERFAHFYPVRSFDLILPFMKELYNYDKQEVYLIKNAKLTTAMASGLESPKNQLSWTDESASTYDTQGSGLYFTLMTDVSSAIQTLRAQDPYVEHEIKAVLLLQGEADSLFLQGQPNFPNMSTGQMADGWGTFFSGTLYSKFQRDTKKLLGNPNMPDIPWIIGRTHIEMEKPLPTGDPSQWAEDTYFVTNVRAQQEAVANDPNLNVHIVDIDGVNSYTDNSKVHFDNAGLKEVGLRFFAKYKEVMENS